MWNAWEILYSIKFVSCRGVSDEASNYFWNAAKLFIAVEKFFLTLSSLAFALSVQKTYWNTLPSNLSGLHATLVYVKITLTTTITIIMTKCIVFWNFKTQIAFWGLPYFSNILIYCNSLATYMTWLPLKLNAWI